MDTFSKNKWSQVFLSVPITVSVADSVEYLQRVRAIFEEKICQKAKKAVNAQLDTFEFVLNLKHKKELTAVGGLSRPSDAGLSNPPWMGLFTIPLAFEGGSKISRRPQKCQGAPEMADKSAAGLLIAQYWRGPLCNAHVSGPARRFDLP